MDRIVDETHISDTQISTSVRTMKVSGTRGKPGPPLAVRLHDVIVHNNKKWIDIFAGADIRVDIVAVQGNGLSGDPHSFYTPTTMRFSGVGDEDPLPIDESGLLAYYGWPKHFLNLAVLVSRDRKGSDDLATMLRKEFTSSDFGSATAALLGLVAATPAAGVVVGALAATIGDIAHRIVAAAFGSTIGIYRGTKLAYPTTSAGDATRLMVIPIGAATSRCGSKSLTPDHRILDVNKPEQTLMVDRCHPPLAWVLAEQPRVNHIVASCLQVRSPGPNAQGNLAPATSFLSSSKGHVKNVHGEHEDRKGRLRSSETQYLAGRVCDRWRLTRLSTR